MLSSKECILGAATLLAAVGLTVTAQAATITLAPTGPGTVSGAIPYMTNETLDFDITIPSPDRFTFTAIGSGGNFPFSIPESMSGTSGFYSVAYGPFPVHGTVDYTLTTTGVPEPATWALLLVGFGGMGATVRSSRRQRAIV